MELVSKILDNIIAIEENEEGLRVELETPKKDQSKEGDTAKTHRRNSLQLLEPPQQVEVVLEKPDGKVSDYWYLEDDQKKVSNQLTDRIMEKLLSVMINADVEQANNPDFRMRVHKTRPPLSMHLMSVNSTQMAQKTSPVFEMVDQIAFIFGWYNPWHTTGALLLGTLTILNPYVMAALPSALVIKKFLVPGYLALYTPDPSLVDLKFTFNNPIPHCGGPVHKYEPPKTLSQFSREFVMNYTDLQNNMVPYIRLYDALVGWGQHYFRFEDQRLSSIVFLLLAGNIIWSLVALPHIVPVVIEYIPVKLTIICIFWTSFAMSHPTIQTKLLNAMDTEEARLARLDKTDRLENSLVNFVFSDEDQSIEITREAEVFEIHVLGKGKIWEPVGFASDFYALNHPRRHLRDLDASTDSAELEPVPSQQSEDSNNADSTRTSVKSDEDGPVKSIFRKATLDEIKAPLHWKFAEESWQIDLDAGGWVQSNLIMDLVTVDPDEKWVYDFAQDEEHGDGQIFRRRRWIRQCVRDGEALKRKDKRESLLGVPAGDRLSKTISNLLLS